MSDIVLLFAILGIHALAVMSPGPDFIMAVKNSLTYSRKTGMRTAVGFGLWISVHILYCVLWLALLISQSILLFQVIKLLGAGYLMWIWLQALFSKSWPIDIGQVAVQRDISPAMALRQGFLTNVLNPKATLFFLGLFTLVIWPTTPLRVTLLAGVMMVVDTILRFMLVAYFFTNPLIRAKVQRWQAALSKFLGLSLLALGVKIAMTD